jgi:O-antigen ligase
MSRFATFFTREPRRIVAVLWPLALLAPFLPFLPRPHNGGPTWRQESVVALLLSLTFAFLVRNLLKPRLADETLDPHARRTPTSRLANLESALRLPLAAFVVWGATSVLWATNVFPAFHYALNWTLFLLFFVTVRRAAFDGRALRLSIALLAVVVVVIAAANVVGYYGSQDSLISQNGLGEPVAVSIPLFAALALRLRRTRAALFCGTAATLGWLSMLEIAERAPFFGVCAALLVLAASTLARREFRPRGVRRVALLAAAFAACLAIQTIPSPFAESRHEQVFVRLKETSASDLNTRARMLFWGAAFEMWRAHPLAGVGADGYDGAYPQARADFAARHPYSSLVVINERYLSSGAHNEYLQIMAELGAVGIVLFLAFCAALVWAAWLALRRSTSPLAQGAVSCLVAFAISSGASSISFRWFGSGLVFFFAAALVARLATARQVESEKEVFEADANRRVFHLATARRACALSLCLSVFVLAAMCVQAANVLLLATAQASGAEPARADSLYRSALALNPFDAATHYNYGVWLAMRKREGEAATHLRYALARGFHSSTCYEYLAGAESNAGRDDEAERTLAEGVRVYPRSVLMRVSHAAALRRLGRAVDANMEMSAALLLDSRAARGWQQLIENDVDAAIDAARRDRAVAMPGELQPEEAVFAVLTENEARFPEAAASGWRARMLSRVQ